MPSSKSHRNQVNKYNVNLSIKTAIRSTVTKLRNSIANKAEPEETQRLLNETNKILDRAAKKKVIHKNECVQTRELEKLYNRL